MKRTALTFALASLTAASAWAGKRNMRYDEDTGVVEPALNPPLNLPAGTQVGGGAVFSAGNPATAAAGGTGIDSSASTGDAIVTSGTWSIRLYNMTTTSPTVNDDVNSGYSILSRWINTTLDKEFVCLDNTVGAAVWTETTAGGGDLKADGTVPLTAAWDAGSWQIRAETFQSDVATGTAPLTVASTTLVTNLNADKLDGVEGSGYSPIAGSSSIVTVGTISSGTWNGTDIGVADGGTGRSTGGLAYAVLCAGTTATGVQQNVASIGTSGQVLTSNGAGALPSFQTKTRTGVYRTIWIDAGAMISRTTSGAASGTEEYATNDVMSDSFAFDPATDEFAQFRWRMPDVWNAGTVKVKFYWTAASGSGDVVWALQATSTADDDPIDAAFGTAQTVTDTLILANDMHITSATAAVTIGNTPVAGDVIWWQVYRDADAVGDTLAVDAKLLGVAIQYLESSTEPSSF